MSLTESTVEEAPLEWFLLRQGYGGQVGDLGYAIAHGPEIAPGEGAAERESFGEVVLEGRLREALRRLNPEVPDEAPEDVLRRVLRVADGPFGRKLLDGETGLADLVDFAEIAG